VGQPNSTEDPKIASDFATIQTWANGNVDDSNLGSPNNGVRRLLLQSTGLFTTANNGDYLLVGAGAVASGDQTSTVAAFWIPDAGVSGQPTDFQVASKSSKCRIRAAFCVNNIAPAVTVKAGLYLLTGVGGVSSGISYSFGTALASTSAAALNAPSVATSVESAQFAMPVTTPNSPYALGINIAGGPAPLGSYVVVTAQLYGYNV
jgi:hypothetical protein